MTIIYVVRGETGQYEEYCHWDAIAYKDKLLAIKHAELAMAKANEILKKYEDVISKYKYGSTEHMELLKSNPYDLNMCITYADCPIKYTVVELKWGG